MPLTFGHEFSGTVEEVGEGVKGEFEVGDRVCVQPIIYDGTCGSCEEGLINCCDNNGFVGLSGEFSWTTTCNATFADAEKDGEEGFLREWSCRNTVSSRYPTMCLLTSQVSF